jgi:hypothetical protein
VDTSFTIIASDGGLADTQEVQLAIYRKNQPPVVTSALVDTINENTLYSYQATAEDPESMAVTISFINVPGWLTVMGEGLFGNVPAGAQDTSFSIIVSDGDTTDTIEVKLVVSGGTWIGTGIPIPLVYNVQFQNPARQDQLSVTFTLVSEQTLTVSLFKADGNRVGQGPKQGFIPGTHSLDIPKPSEPGIYYISFKGNKGSLFRKILVVE